MKKKLLKKHEATEAHINAQKRLTEGCAILLITLSIYILIAFVTYHANDPSWSNSGTADFVENSCGRTGAFISDLFLYFFGYVAYLFPLMLIWASYTLINIDAPSILINKKHLFLRGSGFLMILLSSASIVSLNNLSANHIHFPLTAGGVIGIIFGKMLLGWLNKVGAAIFLIAFILAGITIFTGLSWITILAKTWKYTIFAAYWLKEKAIEIYYEFKDAFAPIVEEEEIPKKPVLITPIAPIAPPTAQKPQNINIPILSKYESEYEIEEQEIEAQEKPKQAENIHQKPVKAQFSSDLPSLSLLDKPEPTQLPSYSKRDLENLSREVEAKFRDFGIDVNVVAIHPGPVITRFELSLAAGIKVAKITSLVKDLARSLSVSSVRIVEIIPGKPVIGLEIPNKNREVVCLRAVLESDRYHDSNMPLSLALGKDISGYPVIVDLAKMPHLLVAGTTGSGKSVSINAMLLSILFKSTPEQVRLIMIDPKMLELSVYDGIPHLLTPVITDVKEAANAFRWCLAEMDRRYRLMATLGVRNLTGYNAKVSKAIDDGKPIRDPLIPDLYHRTDPQYLSKLPFIVLVVDELADMLMVVGKKVEELIARIAQKARAAGINMILATQRPSVDVITGLIKANIPTRIAFQVSSRIDSRTILDQQGAEQLLGRGDMLYLPPGTGHPIRVHGAFVSDEETHRVVADLKSRGEPEYIEDVIQVKEISVDSLGGEADNEKDMLYDQAVKIVVQSRRASISYVQRRLKIGYNRSARILEQMEAERIVSELLTNGSREVLVPPCADE